ncbi:hypothetical protein FACS1894181_16140 [Bacteroidia bacterium]|nr:hypothetical protein FACS1894181_16140 [Bacteroidia bacterium]
MISLTAMGDEVWASDAAYHATLVDGVSPAFGDANHDGISEIAIAGNLFNSVNGQLICSLPAGYPYSAHLRSLTAQLVDIFDDGKVKYVIGDHIYDITLNASNTITGMTLNRVVSLPVNWNLGFDPDYVPDLTDHYSISALFVDMNGDGKLEMIVAHSYASPAYTALYIADPANGNILAAKYIPDANAFGYPLVADVDGDGQAEIVIVHRHLSLQASKGNLQKLNNALFVDMDGDGRLEMIVAHSYSNPKYTVLYIADPADGNILAAKYIPDANAFGYPLVADVDGDGQAEIVIVHRHLGLQASKGNTQKPNIDNPDAPDLPDPDAPGPEEPNTPPNPDIINSPPPPFLPDFE